MNKDTYLKEHKLFMANNWVKHIRMYTTLFGKEWKAKLVKAEQELKELQQQQGNDNE